MRGVFFSHYERRYWEKSEGMGLCVNMSADSCQVGAIGTTIVYVSTIMFVVFVRSFYIFATIIRRVKRKKGLRYMNE